MASTYTRNNCIEQPATGDQSGTWGATVDTNFAKIDEALDSVSTIDLTGNGSSYTLQFVTTAAPPLLARSRVLIFTGTPSSAVTITIAKDASQSSLPQKFYFVVNKTGVSLTFQSTGGATFTLTPQRQSAIIYLDGNGAVYSIPSSTNLPVTTSLTGNSTVTVGDGHTALLLTGSPSSNPATITVTGSGGSTQPLMAWVVNSSSSDLMLQSGTGTVKCSLPIGTASPIYIDGNNDLYGVTLTDNGYQSVTLSGSTATVSNYPGLQALKFVGTPSTGVAVTLTPSTVKGVIWVANACGQTVTLGAVSVANGTAAAIYTDGAGNVSSLFNNTFSSLTVSGALTAGSVSSSGAVSAGSVASSGAITAGGTVTATTVNASTSLVLNGVSCTAVGYTPYTPTFRATNGASTVSVTGTYGQNANSMQYLVMGPIVLVALDVVITPASNADGLEVSLPLSHNNSIPAAVNAVCAAGAPIVTVVPAFLTQGGFDNIRLLGNQTIHTSNLYQAGTQYRFLISAWFTR